MKIGVKSVLFVATGYLFLAGLLFLLALEKRQFPTTAIAIVVGEIACALCLFNIFTIKKEKIVVKYLFNPFRPDLVLFYKDIEIVQIVRTMSSTKVNFSLKDSQKAVTVLTVLLSKKEYALLSDSLANKKIEVRLVL
jgi:hypothetical protein